MMQMALTRARKSVTGSAWASWYDNFDEQTRQAHRTLGRHLLEMLTSYLADPGSRSALLTEIREMGGEYARLSVANALSLSDSVRAFLFFRDLLTDSVIQMAEILSLRTPHDWRDRLRVVNVITDELLLALIDEYERDLNNPAK
jgi:hypothetical protein